MIVVDEQLLGTGVIEGIDHWYRGRVLDITELRPGTVIKDDAIPDLLCRARQSTFITINVTDFWERIRADERYCVLCFPLPDCRASEIPGRLRHLFRLEEFKTKAIRMGKVARVTSQRVEYYDLNHRHYMLKWSM
ncbi:MAG: hypothetical protein HYS70_04475 [Nitrospinae bacterium]|nr:hypothetical protein [Nitrospinota bacterium]